MSWSTIVAAVDIGTNTALMVVGTLRNGSVEILGDFQSTPRLGQGLSECGSISAESLERCKAQLANFRTTAMRLGATVISAVGTAALRMARNGPQATLELSEALGADIRIVDGNEEAFLTLNGVLGAKSQGSVIDIGGGSTELIVRDSRGVCSSSFPVGAVTLTDQTRSFSDILDEIFDAQSNFGSHDFQDVKAVAGTPVSLAILEIGLDEFNEAAIEGFILTASGVNRWAELLKSMDKCELVALRGVDRGRSDILPAGAIILAYVMKKFQISTVAVSTKGLRHGLLITSLNTMQTT